jgi:hypothetical protein
MDWAVGVLFPAGTKAFSLLHSVQTDSGAHQPPIQWIKGAVTPGVKRQGRGADHSPPYSAEVKNSGAKLPLYSHTSSRSGA